jgi:hypothetical protein
MTNLMEALLSLQEKDRAIREIRLALKAVPAREEELKGLIAAQAASLAAAKGRGLAAAETRKQREAQGEELRARASKIKAAQAEAKSNDAYRALAKELAGIESQILQAEDAVLSAMEEEENAAAALEECAAALEKEKAHAAAELEKTAQSLAPQRAMLEERIAERAEAAKDVPEDAYARYERIAKKYPAGAVAVVDMKTGSCGGCHMKLTPSDLLEARKLDTLSACGYCGRLLYANVPKDFA